MTNETISNATLLIPFFASNNIPSSHAYDSFYLSTYTIRQNMFKYASFIIRDRWPQSNKLIVQGCVI